jgi:hypothetical protein
MYKTRDSLEKLSVDEIVIIVDKQPRLQKFVRCLYTDEPYKLSNLKMLDSNNFVIAQVIIKNVYPNHWELFSKHF